MTAPSLWAHQEQAVEQSLRHLQDGGGAMLAMEMGTGKSRVALEIWDRLERPKTLIVAPLAVAEGVWPYQFEKWAKEKFLPNIHSRVGWQVKMREAGIPHLSGHDVVITNYEKLARPKYQDAILGGEFQMVIMDESHRAKAPAGKASRFLSRLSDRVSYRLALTGTPMAHTPLDIYAQYRALNKSIFGTSFSTFRARYAMMGGFQNRQIIGYFNEAELREKFRSIAFTVKASEVLSLPETIDSTVQFNLSHKAVKAYLQAERDLLVDLESGERLLITNVLAKLVRLQQITSGYLPTPDGKVEHLDTGKRDALRDILTDNDDSHIVIFCRFIEDLKNVHEVAGALGRDSFEVSGARSEVEAWREGGGILAAQIQSGGLGIDLTLARTAIYYSVGFSLSGYLQSRARLHRPGQRRNVHYIHLHANGTIDGKVLDALQQRQGDVDAAMPDSDFIRVIVRQLRLL